MTTSDAYADFPKGSRWCYNKREWRIAGFSDDGILLEPCRDVVLPRGVRFSAKWHEVSRLDLSMSGERLR